MVAVAVRVLVEVGKEVSVKVGNDVLEGWIVGDEKSGDGFTSRVGVSGDRMLQDGIPSPKMPSKIYDKYSRDRTHVRRMIPSIVSHYGLYGE